MSPDSSDPANVNPAGTMSLERLEREYGATIDSAYNRDKPDEGSRSFGRQVEEITRRDEADAVKRTEESLAAGRFDLPPRDPWSPPYRHEDLERVRREHKKPEDAIPHYVLGGMNNVLAGASKSFKSFFAAGHNATLSMGVTLDGAECERMATWFLSYEDPIRPLAERFDAVVEFARGKSTAPVRPGYNIVDFQNEKHRHRLMIVTPDGEILEQDDWKKLCDLMAATAGKKFVTIDSFYNAFDFRGASKINESAVMEVLGRLDGLCARTETTIETIAHPSRTAQREGSDSMGFSNAMDAGPRHRVYATRLAGVPGAKMKVVANQYGPEGFEETFYLQNGVLVPEAPQHHQPSDVAVLETVIAGIESAQFVTRDRARRSPGVKLPDYMLTEIERRTGKPRPTKAAIRNVLDREVNDGRWEYTPGTSHDLAGYRPVPVHRQPGYRRGEEEPRALDSQGEGDEIPI